jgi:hypothetical protein
LGVGEQNFTQLGGCADFLRPFIGSCVSGMLQWIQQRNSVRFCENLVENMMETLAMIRQVFGEDSMGHTPKGQTY